MPKHPVIEAMLEDAAQTFFGNSRADSFVEQTCVICGKSATEFTDELSKREYGISGICQICQDSVFE